MTTEILPSWSDFDVPLQTSTSASLLIKFYFYWKLYEDRLFGTVLHGKPSDECISAVCNQIFNIFWELYQANPPKLNRFISALLQPLIDNYADYPPMTTPLLQLLYPHGAEPYDHLYWDSELLDQLQQDIDRQIPELSSTLEQCSQATLTLFSGSITDPVEIEKESKKLYRSPNLTRLQQHLEADFKVQLQELDISIQKLVDDRITTLGFRQGANAPPTSHCGWGRSQLPNSSILLFAPSGSGKTRFIRKLLSAQFGFYFEACCLPAMSDSLKVHVARRNNGSRDTIAVVELLELSDSFTTEWHSWCQDEWIEDILIRLIQCRRRVFSRYITHVYGRLSETGFGEQALHHFAQYWLELQTDPNNDLFNRLFQHSFLTYPFTEFEEFLKASAEIDEGGYFSAFLKTRPFYYCLDEAQADLERTWGDCTLVGYWTRALRAIQNGSAEDATLGRGVFAGTSLKLRKALNEIETFGGELRNRDNTTLLINDFPLITKETFPQVMEEHQTMNYVEWRHKNSSVEECCLIDWITRSVTPLLGRPRWCVQYLCNVNQLLISEGDQDLCYKIQSAADDTAKLIKNELTERLKNLWQRGSESRQNYELLQDICRVAIQCVFLDCSTAFMDADAPILISEALAVMQPDSEGQQRYQFAERLVVDATSEFFLTYGQDMLEKSMNRMIESQQNDMCAMGKVAEVFLVWNLYRIFRPNSLRLTGSSATERLATVLQLFNKAIPLDPNPSNRGLNLDNYSIVEGEKIGYMDTTTSPYELWTWMRHVREGYRPHATFFLPENQAGPDIVFAMRSQDHSQDRSPKVVLCSIQLKIGTFKSLKRAIATTDLMQAYTNRETGEPLKQAAWKDKREKLQDELHEWSRQNLQILRLLVTADRNPNGTDQDRLAQRGSNCEEYYRRCGRNDTELLFGADFDDLLNAVASQGGVDTISEFQRAWKNLIGI